MELPDSERKKQCQALRKTLRELDTKIIQLFPDQLFDIHNILPAKAVGYGCNIPGYVDKKQHKMELDRKWKDLQEYTSGKYCIPETPQIHIRKNILLAMLSEDQLKVIDMDEFHAKLHPLLDAKLETLKGLRDLELM